MDAWIDMLMMNYTSFNYLIQTIEQLKKTTHNERNPYTGTKHINDKRKTIWKTEKRQKSKKKNEQSKKKKEKQDKAKNEKRKKEKKQTNKTNKTQPPIYI